MISFLPKELKLLTLNSKIFFQQNEFIWKQRIAIWDMQANKEPQASPENKGKRPFIEKKGSSEGLL